MKPILIRLKSAIDHYFENLSKRDVEEFEDGKPVHITYSEGGKTLRAILFFERWEI
jgi:hypothetical protein